VTAAKPSQDTSNRTGCDPSNFVEKIFYLANAAQPNEANELVTALRNLLNPCDKLYLVPSQSAIIAQAPPDQLALAQKVLGELDRPRKTYRLTYTITEMDGPKRVGSERYAMTVADGQRTVMKQGSKVPLVTGSYTATTPAAGTQTQVTYLDTGMNFDATLSDMGSGAMLKSKVEQSSVAEEKSGVGPQDPVVRQTSLEGASFLTLGKTLMLGSLDITGSKRHLDVEVIMDIVP
jgi:type II secretory pathway component GspD/PulD (secretin)